MAKKILILGSSSWVAHYLIQEFQSLGFEVIGFSNKKNPKIEIENYNFDILSPSYIDEVKKIDCSYIVNMTNSAEYERSFEIHKELADYCKNSNKHYTYFSSSNARDGKPDQLHYETDLGIGQSDYGKHKAECEHYLQDEFPDALIVRFGATHGYAPNRVARTEDFLQRLQKGEDIICITKFYQGRTFVGHLAKMISKATSENEKGIFHMSSINYGSELEFLKNLAEEFGYNQARIVPGEEINWDLTLIPKKIIEKYGDDYKFTQEDAIKELGRCSYLEKYRN